MTPRDRPSHPIRLAVFDIGHAYGVDVVLRGVSLTAREGEVHCLLGPSGSGKSTLLRLIAGLEVLQRGRIEIGGVPVAGPAAGPSGHVAPERRAVGFVFQDFALFPHLDARRNVLFGMPPGPASDRRAAADALLARVGLADFATAMPHTLSGGQQQRVALVRALARRPVVMLLDEPFSGLDARLREEVRATTLDVLRAAGVATLMVTHDPQEALAVADRVSVIRDGVLLQTGTPDEVYERSLTRAVAEVFGPVNCLTTVVRAGRVELPWGNLPAPGLADGTEVEVLVRPESLRLEEFASGSDSSSTATITRVVREGALARLTVRLAKGRDFTVHDFAHRAADHGWSVGRRVRFSVPAEAVTICPRPAAMLSRPGP